MIVEDMRNTGVLGMPEEWFLPWTPEKTEVVWPDAFASVRRRATSENGVMAVKVMANQLHNVEGCLATFVDTEMQGAFGRFYESFKDAIWFKLSRQDIVAQAISRVMSRQTGINHATASENDAHFAGNLKAGYDSSYNEATVYRYGAILREVSAIAIENLVWDRFFETFGITAQEFVYEDVAKDMEMLHLDAIAAAAGITEPLEKSERKLVKMANQRNVNWRNRFLDDAAALNFTTRKT